MFKKIWDDPVWSKVIAGVILAIGAVITAYVLDWWATIGRWANKGWGFLFESTSIVNWLFVVMAGCSLLVVLLAITFCWSALLGNEKNPTRNWRDYRTDNLFGLRWRWQYSGGSIVSLYSCCPHCDYQVYAQDFSNDRFDPHIRFICDSCGQMLGDHRESLASVENKVGRFIDQKIRNDSWNIPVKST